MAFRTRTPRRAGARVTKLYRVWNNMSQRVRGQATEHPEYFKGVPLAWSTFAEFRAWAITHGFSKEHCSPDRIRSEKGYVPGNVRFVTVSNNMLAAAIKSNFGGRGKEPPPEDYEVPF